MTDNIQNRKVEELAQALADDPWVPPHVRKCCMALLKRWREEDSADEPGSFKKEDDDEL